MTSFYYIQNSIVDMREHPSFHSKVVSQAVFAENIQLENTQDDWSYIVTSDGYSGWIPSRSFVSRNHLYEKNLQVSRLTAHLYGLKDIEYGPIKTLPYNSSLQILDSNDVRWIKVMLPNDKEGYIQKGDVIFQGSPKNKYDLTKFSQRFLGLPYTWGGRSSFGYDCSGFIQMLYEHIRISLPRDSKQQAIDTRFQTIQLHSLEPGDLIFFGNSHQHIQHVGLSLDKKSFIHATSRENQPWIRISQLSDFEWSGNPNVAYPYRIGRSLNMT